MSNKQQFPTRGDYDASTATKTKPGNRLFVYGIFLGQAMRDRYGMYNAHYETVLGFITVGGGIVQACRADMNGASVALTGLTVDIDPSNWQSLDRLEGGYDRIIVETHSGERVWMYASKGTKGVDDFIEDGEA